MQRLLILGLKALMLVMLVGLIGCEGDIGPTGPQGTQGPVGPQGVAGVDGQDGQNGAENCVDCHGNNQVITAKIFQWENSGHYLGGAFERNIAVCAGCHTSQGFLDRLATGSTIASMTIQDPLPQNCYTCHQIHQTYTADDWALTAPDPVTLWVGGETVDVGTGNQCLNCHQPRVPNPALPDVGDEGMVEITSTRYGPHHGAQGALFAGVGAYEIGDGYTNSAHTGLVANACVSCHMATTIDGRGAGGHTFRVETADGDLNANGCVQCHSEDGLEDLVANTQAEVEDLLAELNTLLVDVGIMQENGRSIPGTYTALQVGALWNYKYVEEDNSKGVHNAKYAMTLLENSIAAL